MDESMTKAKEKIPRKIKFPGKLGWDFELMRKVNVKTGDLSKEQICGRAMSYLGTK